MNPTILIAIDPGKSGGMAIRTAKGSVRVARMPDTETAIGDALEDAVAGIKFEGWDVRIAIEKVGGFIKGHPSPGSSMFNFGRGVGFIIGWCVAREIPFIEVPPQTWQKAVGVGQSKTHNDKPAWKRHLCDHARKLYPTVEGVTLSTCDAILILEWMTRDICRLPPAQIPPAQAA